VALGSKTRPALLLRAFLGFFVGLPAAALALMHLGWASPFGVVLAVPAVYLLKAALSDAWTLLRHAGAERFQERPRFMWFLVAGVLCLAYWSARVLA
jgi:hypothetical protein